MGHLSNSKYKRVDGVLIMKAYMLNDHYIFLKYEDLSSLIFDVVHFSHPASPGNSHTFSIHTGEMHVNQKVFINDNGERTPVFFDKEYALYYSASTEQSNKLEVVHMS